MQTAHRNQSSGQESTPIRKILTMLLVGTQVWAPLGASAASPLPTGTVPTGGSVQFGNVTIRAPIGIGTGNRVVIDQASQRAIINWNTFNIAAGSEVRFNQPNAGASVLNRIFDLNPTIIQGKLSANGQVYLLNQNGILFDKGSQVNVHSLLASTLNLDDNVYKNSGLAAGPGTPALTAFPNSSPHGIVLKGTIETLAGGAVYVFAPEVRNEGVITSPDGQVILAAGHTVYLYENPNPNDFSMRGLFVEVRAEDRPVDLTKLLDGRAVTPNTVTNTGQIRAARGNVTLAGLAVNQEKLVSASSAALQNGSVWLLAKSRGDAGQVAKTGKVTLAAGSVTETPLDVNDATTLADDQDYSPYRSVVRVEGKVIDHKGTIASPGGIVSLTAFDPENTAATNTTRVHLDAGSIIDVSGTWVDLALSKAFLSIKVTSNELKDAPVQKGGLLLGETVTVDLREGTPLFDISSYAGSVKRSVAEKTATAGEIRIESQSGDVIMRQGATLDVSGGGYRYSGGFNEVTRLVSQGKTYSVSDASADRIYDGLLNVFFVNHKKWGVTERFQLFPGLRGSYEAPSVEGKAAGLISINAVGGAVMEGNLLGGAVAGRHQISKGNLPQAGSFIAGDIASLGTASQDFRLRKVVFEPQRGALSGSFVPETALADGSTALTALPGELAGNLVLPLDFFRTGQARSDGGYDLRGFGAVTLLANESIEVPEWARIELPAAGALTMVSNQLTVAGDIVAPGGTVDLRATNTTGATNPALLRITQMGSVSARGLWINDGPNAPPSAKAALLRLINGGSVKLSGLSARIETGSLIDVSGGGRIDPAGKLSAGNGGSISVRMGEGAQSLDMFDTVLDGELRGYGPGKGGTLEIATGRVRIGDSPGSDLREVLLTPDLFRRGGFSNYSIDGRFGLTVASGTRIEPVATSLQLDAMAVTQPTGSDLFAFATPVLLPQHRRTPANLSLSASNATAGTLTLESAAVIRTEPRAKVSLSAKAAMDIRGRIEAPAGEIRLSLAGGANDGFLPDGTLHLASGSALISRGYFVEQPNALGRTFGEVLDGGTVTLNALKNRIVADEGSLIDVSGIEQVIDIRQRQGTYEATRVAGNAGSVLVSATQGARLDGTLLAAAPQGAAGGSFAFDLLRHEDTLLTDDAMHRIVATQSAMSADSGSGAIDGYVRLGTLAQNGFDKIRLGASDAIEFRGDVNVAFARSASFDAPDIGASAATLVRILAPRLSIGNSGDRVNELAIATPVATRPGAADLVLQAGSQAIGGAVSPGEIDIFGSVTLNGFDTVSLRSYGDVRLIGKPIDGNSTDALSQVTGMAGFLATNAPVVNIESARLYPTSGSEFRIAVEDVAVANGAATHGAVAGGKVNILARPGPTARVLSAGGALTIAADAIDHSGVIQAPLGTITLAAGNLLTLKPGSVTDVSGNGLTIPFGETLNGRDWFYNSVPVSTSPGKRVSLTGAQVVVEAGAKIDVSGGGELQSVEFVPGPGGSRDVLLQDGVYAILPWLQDAFGPYDSHMLSKKDPDLNADTNVYDSVYLSDGAGVPPGTYVLLPGYYALLPGAFVVTAAAATQYRDLAPGQVSRLLDGTAVVAGYRSVAGTGVRESRWSGFTVQSGTLARRESEYRIGNSSFFAELARLNDQAVPRLPLDAGRLTLAATGALDFKGSLAAVARAGGRIAEVDFAAANIAVTASAAQPVPDGYLALDAATLSGLNASILLGGSRRDVAGGTEITVNAGNILVANDASSAWTSPEIILAASDSVTLADGARLKAAGSYPLASGNLMVRNAAGGSDGALVRVAAGSQVQLRRENPARAGGTLVVGGSAQLEASGSIILDATSSTSLIVDPAAPEGFRQIVLGSRGALALGAQNIKVGFDGDAPGALVLTTQQLQGFSGLDSLRLKSYTSLDLYGDAVLGNANYAEIVVDAASIQGWRKGSQDSAAVLQAKQVRLLNLGAESGSSTADGSGQLSVIADTLVLGEGRKSVTGFGSVLVSAREQIIAQSDGDNAFGVGGTLTIRAGRITATSGSSQSITAAGLIDAHRHDDAPQFTQIADGLGAQIGFVGRSVSMDGRIDLAAGTLMLQSTGSGDDDKVVLGDNAIVNAGAYAKQFGSEIAYANGGELELVSAGGGIDIKAGANVDLAGTAGGGNAGILRISALGANASVTLDGTIGASAANGEQGRFAIDTHQIGNFSALNAKLNQAGFTRSHDIRVRSGDLVVAAADTVVAHDLRLAADNGSIRVLGTIDASNAKGDGKVHLYGGEDVVVGNAGRIQANGTSTDGNAYSHGGSVELYARDGIVEFAAGGLIDVSSGARGDAGEVVFSALRTDTNNGVNAALNGTVIGAATGGGQTARVIVEGRRSYNVATIGADVTSAFDQTNTVWSEYDAFMSAAADLTTGLQDAAGNSLAGVRYQAGVELVAETADLALDSAWDLTNANWMRNSEASRLTLRSGRNLDINSYIGLPSDNPTPTSSWSLRLVGGADFDAANPMATLDLKEADYGDVTLTTAASRVRTSDGNIEIAAGRNFAINNAAAAVFTTGLPLGTDSRFATGGGDVSILARNDAKGTIGQQWINDWLRRTTLPRGIADFGAIRSQPAEWWVHKPLFRQNVGSFGGGSIEVVAGNDIASLSAMSPTSGRYNAVTDSLEVYGGGDVTIAAGRNIISGEYMLGSGNGFITAGGSVGSPTARTALFLLGEHQDPALRVARFSVEAYDNIFLQNAANPTMLASSIFGLGAPPPATPGFGLARSVFFTYAPNAEVAMLSLAGNVNIGNLAAQKTGAGTGWSDVAPPRLSAVAMSGDVRTERYLDSNLIRLYPSSDGALRLLAAGNVANLYVEAVDVLPESLPSFRKPEAVSTNAALVGEGALLGVISNLGARIVTPGSKSGVQYAIAAATGDIRDIRLYLPSVASIEAGNDIVNLQLNAQNLETSDRTRVVAGRDIRFTGLTSEGAPFASGGHLLISGPGEFFVRAGRNIDLGTSGGIVARGDADNASLPTSQSARLIVVAGAKRDISAAQSDALFSELLLAGLENDTVRANATIDALFPETAVAPGNLAMVFSKIKTEGGSGIDLFAPGGSIEAGVTAPQNREIGIITTLGGPVRTYLSGDFNINQSKAITLQGGDILAYTSNGSIDAGRGARDSRTTQPPRRSKDSSGLTIFIPPQDASGSGIRTLTSDPDGAGPLAAPDAGDVYLFAPRGVIDAGEAGIASGGNIVVAALQILNATNISAGGSSTGVPLAPTTTLAASLSGATSAASAATKSAEEATRNVGSDSSGTGGLQQAFKPTFITVEVLGLGEEGSKLEDKK